MCTITRKRPELKVAKKDIVVYKVVFPVSNTMCYAFCRAFKYEKGKIYETQLDPFKETWNRFQSGKGFYSYMLDRIANAEFIIPEGATYYLARDLCSGCMIYHSSQIIFNRMLK